MTENEIARRFYGYEINDYNRVALEFEIKEIIKQTWDEACRAQRALDIHMHYWNACITNAPLAPYPTEEEEAKETQRSMGI